MTDVPQPPAFESDDAYERSLSDPAFWAPYARAALQVAGFPDDGEVITHFPTTHVAALVGDHHMVKLHYEDWFGEDCFQTEREAYQMLAGRGLPIPELLAEGALYPDTNGWRWPFLVMTAMHGRSMRDLGDTLTTPESERAADFVGATLRALHATPIRDGEYISFEEYADLIRTRMARCHRDHELWGSLPERFLPQVRDYVWAARDLLEPNERRTSLLHGDLHAGNVFLNGVGGAREPSGIVDFNDAYEGDPHYDLVAIHTEAFGADKRLLQRVLDAYHWGDLGRKWPQRMMALTLAHDHDMVQPYAKRIPDEIQTLDELASLLWELDAPGLP